MNLVLVAMRWVAIREGTKTESAETICSWCLEEQGIKPDPNDSHGVCQRHKKVLMADIERAKVLGKSQFA